MPVGVSVEVVGVVVATGAVVAAGVIWGCGCRWNGATLRDVWDGTGGPGGGWDGTGGTGGQGVCKEEEVRLVREV